jgi:hypothetical protein
MHPLVILVGICKAWKKEVFSGPRVVAWAGTLTSRGARAPALAGAFTYNRSYSYITQATRTLMINDFKHSIYNLIIGSSLHIHDIEFMFLM